MRPVGRTSSTHTCCPIGQGYRRLAKLCNRTLKISKYWKCIHPNEVFKFLRRPKAHACLSGQQSRILIRFLGLRLPNTLLILLDPVKASGHPCSDPRAKPKQVLNMIEHLPEQSFHHLGVAACGFPHDVKSAFCALARMGLLLVGARARKSLRHGSVSKVPGRVPKRRQPPRDGYGKDPVSGSNRPSSKQSIDPP